MKDGEGFITTGIAILLVWVESFGTIYVGQEKMSVHTAAWSAVESSKAASQYLLIITSK
jgi:uncharacterized membrane protein YoaT (DUF817 family)